MKEHSVVRDSPVRDSPVRDTAAATPDWMAELASDLDQVTRVTTRLRPDGLIEVVVTGEVFGYIDHVSPVFVALVGERPSVAVEIAQRRTLREAVDVLRAHRDGRI